MDSIFIGGSGGFTSPGPCEWISTLDSEIDSEMDSEIDSDTDSETDKD
ncbi:TPA: hypothetical protein ACGOY0_002098 [Streptococcus suis]